MCIIHKIYKKVFCIVNNGKGLTGMRKPILFLHNFYTSLQHPNLKQVEFIKRASTTLSGDGDSMYS